MVAATWGSEPATSDFSYDTTRSVSLRRAVRSATAFGSHAAMSRRVPSQQATKSSTGNGTSGPNYCRILIGETSKSALRPAVGRP